MKKRKLLFISVTLIGLLLVVAYLILTLATPYSAIARAVIWGSATVEDYKKFPARVISNASPMFTFSRPADPEQYASRFATISYPHNGQPVVEDFETFLETTQTTAFIVIKDDVILYEKYLNGYDHASTQTSFSVAKSFVSALVGIAIHEGHIKSVDDPVTDYIPELAAQDERFAAITIRHLLTMSSGIRYVEQGVPWSDDSTTYFAPDLRALALSAQIEGEPGRSFHYNNFHPLLLGLILERATGQSVSQYLEEKIWQPLGMEAPGSWSLDSEWSGFEKLESGLNARALDFARFGRLYLYEGNWNGQQLIPQTWVKESTRADTTTDPAPFYQYFWWVSTNQGQPGHFSARGNHGQYIYVVPEQRLVMVRFGKAFGYGRGDAWPRIFEQIATKVAVEANVKIKEDAGMTSGSFNPGALVRGDEEH